MKKVISRIVSLAIELVPKYKGHIYVHKGHFINTKICKTGDRYEYTGDVTLLSSLDFVPCKDIFSEWRYGLGS